jgi:hypothetical protein
MRVERFFHIRPFGQTRGGATVRVVGDTANPSHVEIQAVCCSRKDPYNKAVGREMAAAKPAKRVALRYLPKELAEIEQAAGSIVHNVQMKKYPADYTFALKYFLPKE